METYKGVKFRIISQGEYEKPKHVSPLISEIKNLQHDGAQTGNISFREDDYFWITKSGANLKNLKPSDFIKIKKINFSKKEVTIARAQKPSSETLLHAYIYENRPEINLIFHLHDEKILKRAEERALPITAEEKPYGTPELIAELAKILHKGNYLVLKNHGIIALGSTLKETKKLCLSKH